ncbi:MAG: NADH-quinone oxidoreductase subunit NuoK [Phycisphaeraceae bacterium]|nr:NADH-quinone oxidoreductase subunit NuoK [Phycisphaeraceae bacterium]
MNSFLQIGLGHFVALSLLVLAAGVATVLTKRNAIGILIGVELILNAAGINLVAFNALAWPTSAEAGAAVSAAAGALGQPALDGMVFTIFLIVLAAAEAAVALAIFLNFYNNFNSIDVEKANAMRG